LTEAASTTIHFDRDSVAVRSTYLRLDICKAVYAAGGKVDLRVTVAKCRARSNTDEARYLGSSLA